MRGTGDGTTDSDASARRGDHIADEAGWMMDPGRVEGIQYASHWKVVISENMDYFCFANHKRARARMLAGT